MAARLLAIGRLYPEKRWDRLLKAIALLAARKITFSVRLAGDGPLLKELQSQARHLGVDGLGRIPRSSPRCPYVAG